MLELNINDMTCNHCVASITKAVRSVAPDANVQADLDRHRIQISGTNDSDAVIAAINDIGFTAEPVGN